MNKSVESDNAPHCVSIRPRYLCKCRRHLGRSYRRRKIVVLGDMHCGKSSLIAAYRADRFRDTYAPTIGEMFQIDLQVDEAVTADFVIVDCPGRSDYACIRRYFCRGCDVALLCYATDCRQSLEHVAKRWYPELQEYAPGTPVIIVGTKSDIRDLCLEKISETSSASYSDNKSMSSDNINDTSSIDLEQISIDWSTGSTGSTEEGTLHCTNFVSEADGDRLAMSIGAVGFVECSAKYRVGVRSVFDMAAKLAMLQRSKRPRHCSYNSEDACTIL